MNSNLLLSFDIWDKYFNDNMNKINIYYHANDLNKALKDKDNDYFIILNILNIPYTSFTTLYHDVMNNLNKTIKNMNYVGASRNVIQKLLLNNFTLINNNISDKQYFTNNINFVHIPKTGGTTITNVFKNYLNINIGHNMIVMNKNKNKNKIFIKDESLKIPIWHVPIQMYKKEYQNKLLSFNKMIAIVRNPYDRIISDYKYWTKIFNTTKESKRRLSHHIHGHVSKENLNLFIKSVFNNYEDLYFLYMLDGHLIPMYMYTHINNKLIAEIIKFENLSDEFDSLIERKNIKLPKNILKVNHDNKTINNLTVDDLDLESIKLINKVYAKDFKYFGYEYALSL